VISTEARSIPRSKEDQMCGPSPCSENRPRPNICAPAPISFQIIFFSVPMLDFARTQASKMVAEP
jgi:hypothetical protein